MHEGQSLQYLVEDVSDGGFGVQLGAVLEHLIEVLLHVLKYKVEPAIIAK